MYEDLVKRLRELQVITEHCDEQSCYECANKELCDKFDNKTLSATHKQAADAIEELSKPRWISMKERLPGKYESVWTFSKFGMLQDEYLGEYDGENYFARQTTHVTHWMPLPAPPKEETE